MPIHHQRVQSIPQIRLEQDLPPLPLLPTTVSPVAPRIRIQIPDQLSYEPYHDEEEEESEDEEQCANEGAGRSQETKKLRRQPYSDNLLSPVTSNRASSPTQTYHNHSSPTSPTRTTITLAVSRPQSPSPISNTSQISPRTVLPPTQQDESSKPPDYEPMYDYLRSHPRPFHAFASPNSNTFLSPTSQPQSPTEFTPYHDSVDHPFIITLSPLTPHTRPNYNHLQTAGEEENPPPSYEELYLQFACPQRQDELQELVRQMDSENNWAEEICKFVVGMVLLTLVIVGVGLAFNWGKGWSPPEKQCRGWYDRSGRCVY